MPFQKSERFVLSAGDLCMFTENPDVFRSFRRGVIYQVVTKETAGPASLSHFRYGLRVAFDLENPSGSPLEVLPILGTNSLRKLSLVDVGTARAHFDDFIRWWAQAQGTDDEVDVEEGRTCLTGVAGDDQM